MANPQVPANLPTETCEDAELSASNGTARPVSWKKMVGEAFRRHGFVALPTDMEGTKLALRYYEGNGLTRCDVLAYREADGRGESLGGEAALLARSLRKICQHIENHPGLLSPLLRQMELSFLGRKVHILCNPYGRPILCRLHPLLILPSSNSSPEPSSSANIPVLPANRVEQYLGEAKFSTQAFSIEQLEKWVSHLRRSHKLLGLAALALPLLLGLAGLMACFGMVAAAALEATAAGLVPLLLLILSLSSFSDFKRQNPYTPVTDYLEEKRTSAQSRSRPRMLNTVGTGSWNAEATVAFLLDAVSSSAAASISSLRSRNWQAFAGHLRAFLLGGLRLAYFKFTGQLPTGQLNEILEKLPIGDERAQLEVLVKRLAQAQRGHPFTQEEAREASSFVFSLIHRLQTLRPSWQHRTSTPRRAPLPSTAPSSPANLVQHVASSQSLTTETHATGNRIRDSVSKQDQAKRSRTDETLPSSRARTPASKRPATRTRNRSPKSKHMSDRLDVMGVTLVVDSERDHARLADMVRAGASPYLLVFADSYQPEWRMFKRLIESAATELNGQANIILFPHMGDDNLHTTIRQFFDKFRVENSSSPPSLPFLVALSRQLLLNIVEDGMPVPNELVVEPNPEGFIERVRDAVEAARAYQTSFKEAEEAEKEKESAEEDPQGGSQTGKDLSSPPHGLREHLEEPPRGKTEEAADNGESDSEGASPPVSIQRNPNSGEGEISPSSLLLAENEDVIEEVAEASSEEASHVVEVDLKAALEQRKLSPLVVIAQAVVRLPDDQEVVDALEAAAREEQYLVAQYVDLDRHPEACQVLQLERGQIRIHYDGKERLVDSPNPKHLLAILRQLRAVEHLINRGEAHPLPVEAPTNGTGGSQSKAGAGMGGQEAHG